MTRFGFALLAALLPLALSADEKKDAKAPEGKKDAPKADVFTSKEGRFSVAVPMAPTEKTNKIKVGDRELDHHVFTVKQADRALLVTWIDYPKDVIGGDRDKFLAGVAERNAGSLKGKVAANEKVSLGKGKHPGRDVRVELPEKKQLYRARVYLVGERLYQVAVLGPEEFVKGKEVDDYLNSFAVTE